MGLPAVVVPIIAESGEFVAAVSEAEESLGGLSEAMGSKTTGAAQQMASAIESAMSRIGESINTVMSKLASGDMAASNTTEALAAGFSKLTGINIEPAVQLIDKLKENLLELDNLAKVTGVSAGVITEMKDAMEQAGIPTQSLSDNLVSLRESMGKAQSGSSELRQDFEKLGVSTKGWEKEVPPSLTVLEQMADHFRSSKLSADDLARAHAILGDRYQDLITYLQRGSQAIKDDLTAHQEHGKAVEESIKSAKELQAEEAGLAEKLQTLLLPAFRFVVGVVHDVIAIFIQLKGVVAEVQIMISGAAKIMGDAFMGVTTIMASVGSHWRQLLQGDFSGVVADAKNAFGKMEGNFRATMTAMQQAAQETNRELGNFNAQQNLLAFESQAQQTNAARQGSNARTQVRKQEAQQAVAIRKNALEPIILMDKEELQLVHDDAEQLQPVFVKLGTALDQLNEKTQKVMQSVAQSMATTFSSAIKGMITGTETLGQAFAKMGQQMLSSLESVLEKMLEEWLQQHITELLIHTQTKEAEVGVDEAASAQKQAISMQEHIKEVFMAAKQAAVNAWKALAGIPVVGPALGAAAATATFAAVMAFGSLTSAAGGFYEVDRDQLALIHKKEMVLPASIAERLRSNLASGADSSADLHVHVYSNVNAIDSASFKDTIKQHGNMIGNEVARILKKRNLAVSS
ncbi:MAG TPA: hypothetical protein VFR24_26030 [Candidatus Angelobacter sp.]|nr:hypothetical protein [Candidatus Angelobacter sp.]